MSNDLNELLFRIYRAGFDGDLRDYETYKKKVKKLIQDALTQQPENEPPEENQ